MTTDTPAKPKRQSHTTTAASQTRARVEQTKASTSGDALRVARSMEAISRSQEVLKKTSKLGAEKLTPEEQKRRFIEAAREAGASEDEAVFDSALKRIAKAKPASQP